MKVSKRQQKRDDDKFVAAKFGNFDDTGATAAPGGATLDPKP